MRTLLLAASFFATLISGCGGGGGGGNSAPPPNPVPSISSISPSGTTAGGAAFTLTVNGSNFIASSVIQWSGVSQPTTYVSSTQLTASIAASEIATAGTSPVTVVNPAPGGGASGANQFSTNNAVPSITSLSPSSVTVGAAAFTLTVNGADFVRGSTVELGGSTRTTTYVSTTELTASISASDVATLGSFGVTVVNPAPGGGSSGSSALVVGNPLPTVASVSPTSIAAGGPAPVLSVTGTNFMTTSTVQWNGSARTTTYVSPTLLTASLSAADIAAVGTASIDVVNPSPGGGSTATTTISVQAGGRYLAADVGLWAYFDHRCWPSGYYPGEVIQTWNQMDTCTGTTVAQEISSQLDTMHAMGVNTIAFDLRSADNVSPQAPFAFPNCYITPATGFQYPQPTATELSNFPLFLNMLQSKGMKLRLALVNTHMDETTTTNWQTWVGSILGAVGNHPALDLVAFDGNVHVIDTTGNGVPDSCGPPAEPPLWTGPGTPSNKYVQWAIGYAISLGIAPSKLTAESVVGSYDIDMQQPSTWPASEIAGGHLWNAVSVMKGIFDALAVPAAQRTYALSMYEERKCAYAEPGLPCTDERDDAWADETLAAATTTIGPSAARTVLFEFGNSAPVNSAAWSSPHAFENIAALSRKYALTGGSYYAWSLSDSTLDSDPTQIMPITRRGPTYSYTAAQLELLDFGGYHLFGIPNPSFEVAASNGGAPPNWIVAGDGTAKLYDLTQESGQPEVATRGTFALRLVSSSALASVATATSAVIGVRPSTTYTTTANLRFAWTGDPNPSGPAAQRPQVAMTILYFKADGTASTVRVSDTTSWFQENSTSGFGTFPVQYTTPSDAAEVAIQFAVVRHGLPTAITLDVDNVR